MQYSYFPFFFVKFHIVESVQQTFHVLKLRICVDTLSFLYNERERETRVENFGF